MELSRDVQEKAIENYAALNRQYRKGNTKTGVIGYCIYTAYGSLYSPAMSVENVASLLRCDPRFIYSAMSICSTGRTGIATVTMTPQDTLIDVLRTIERSYQCELNNEMRADLTQKFVNFALDQRTKQYTLRTLTIAFVYRYLSLFYTLDMEDFASRMLLTPATITTYLRNISELGY